MKKVRDITSIRDLNLDYIMEISQRAEEIFIKALGKKPERVDRLSNDSSILLFNQPSTRTYESFDTAFRARGCIDIRGHRSAKESSLVKGESLLDTMDTYAGQWAGPKFVVLRDPLEGSSKWVRKSLFRAFTKRVRHYAKRQFDFPHNLILPIVYNGGSGSLNHPSQLILDAATINHFYGRVTDIKFGECNDLGGSRVVSSHIAASKMLGWEMHLCPFDDKTAKLNDRQKYNIIKTGATRRMHKSVLDMLKFIDLLYVSRYQFNLRGKETGAHAADFFTSDHPQITLDLILPYVKAGLLIAHARPVDRNANEIHPELFDCEFNISNIQSDFGVFARTAMIDYALDNDMFDLENIVKSFDPEDYDIAKVDLSSGDAKEINEERYTTSTFSGRGYVIDHIPLRCGTSLGKIIEKWYPEIQMVYASNVKGDNPDSKPKDQVKLHIPDDAEFEWSAELDSLVSIFSDFSQDKGCRVSYFIGDRRAKKWGYKMLEGDDTCINEKCVTRPEYGELIPLEHRNINVGGHNIYECPYCETPQPSEELESLLKVH